MDASVRWLYDRIEGYEPALILQGKKYASCVVLDTPIRVFTLDVRRVKEMRIVEKNEQPYPLVSFAKYYLEQERKRGITLAAKRLCEAVISGASVEDELDADPDADLIPPTDNPKDRKSTVEIKEDINEKNHPTPKKLKIGVPKLIGPSVIAAVCTELGMEPKEARKKLRAAGMHAPYVDLEKIHAVLKSKA